jgi:hypothetical protein
MAFQEAISGPWQDGKDQLGAPPMPGLHFGTAGRSIKLVRKAEFARTVGRPVDRVEERVPEHHRTGNEAKVSATSRASKAEGCRKVHPEHIEKHRRSRIVIPGNTRRHAQRVPKCLP